jgi:hypothetical protein
MGYSYCEGRLCCDHCGGNDGTVRKRTCPHFVYYGPDRDNPAGFKLPYCYPAALCKACYATLKPTLHNGCAEAAAAQTVKQTARRKRLESGEYEVKSAFGDWHASVPEGWTGVLFRGLKGDVYRLVPHDDYDPHAKRYLSDYLTTRPWADPDAKRGAA